MIAILKKLVKDLSTEDDGTSYCVVRVSFVVGIIAYITLGFHSIPTLNLVDFAKGFSLLLVTGGTAIGIKTATQKSN